jgi:hypothetical protein
VLKLKGSFNSIYIYLSFSPKRYFDQCKLAKLLDTKDNKLLHNLKTRWMSMLFPTKKVLEEYKPLIMNMKTMISMCYPTCKKNFGMFV